MNKLFGKASGLPIGWIHAAGAVGVLAMIALTAYLSWARFQESTLYQAHSKAVYSTTRAELDKQSEIARRLAEQERALLDRVASLPKLQKQDGYNMLSAQIADLAEDAGIQIDELQPEDKQVQGRISWVPIRCAGEGSVDTLLAWLDELETQWPDIVIESINVGSDESGGMVRLEALFRWYVLADDA
jgi:hypothetical protein